MQHLLEIWKQICESNLFNFVVMIWILGWMVKKFDLGNKIELGRKKLEKNITDAESAKDESLKTLYEVQNSVTSIDEKMLDILRTAEENAKTLGEKLLEESEKLKLEIGKSGEKTIDSNIKSLKTEITKETALEAVKEAEEHIKSELKKDSSLQERYIDESLDALESIDGVKI